jgi:hyaluronoglucosaminidase
MLGTIRGPVDGGGPTVVRGIIEGFYGTPWTWADRSHVCRILADAGMDTYVYAPKDDPLHRQRWRDPYPDSELDGFVALVEDRTLRVGVTISPGLSMDFDSDEDRAALLRKVHQMTGVGVSLVGLLLDDLEPADGLGRHHGELTAWLRSELDPSIELFMVPLHYTGVDGVAYLRELATVVPHEVAIGWTGRYVVNRSVTVEDARAWRTAMGGRRPLLWDNTPVNDALMAHHLFTGPLRGREPELLSEIGGYLANPMVQARAGLPALVSAAAWSRGDDPVQAWERSVGHHRVFMEACDGAAPARLAEAGLAGDAAALEALEVWFAEAEECEAADLGEEVQPWVDQVRAEAAVGRVAVGLLRADPQQAARTAPLLHLMWPSVRSSPTQVLGGRGSLVAAFGQDERSRWVAASESYREPANVVDRLVAAVFARLD